ncbi:hypothetical protein Dimus_027498 [Dionaea muscipula]
MELDGCYPGRHQPLSVIFAYLFGENLEDSKNYYVETKWYLIPVKITTVRPNGISFLTELWCFCNISKAFLAVDYVQDHGNLLTAVLAHKKLPSNPKVASIHKLG